MNFLYAWKEIATTIAAKVTGLPLVGTVRGWQQRRKKRKVSDAVQLWHGVQSVSVNIPKLCGLNDRVICHIIVSCTIV